VFSLLATTYWGYGKGTFTLPHLQGKGHGSRSGFGQPVEMRVERTLLAHDLVEREDHTPA
jgi:microcystin-dependent protein